MKAINVTNTESTKWVLTNTETIDGAAPVEIKIEYDLPEKVGFKSCEDAKAYMDKTAKIIDALVLQWSDATEMENGEKVAKVIYDHIDQLVKLHNSASNQGLMRDCKNHDQPLLWACTKVVYPTLSVREVEDNETKEHSLEVKSGFRRINIEKLHKSIDGGIGVDKNWYYTVQAVNKVFTAKMIIGTSKPEHAAERLKALDDSYHMSDIAKKISLGENPVSNSKTLALLRTCVSQMIGEEYAKNLISYDVKFITYLYAKESKKNEYGTTIEAATHKRLYDLLLRVCYHLISGVAYDVIFKEAKKA